MPGLYISARPGEEARLAPLLRDFDLPVAAITRDASAIADDLPRAAFLRAASVAVLLGQALPGAALAAILHRGAPLPSNVLRRHAMLRLSLLPYLRVDPRVTAVEGGFLVGDALLILPVSPNDTVDAPLPPGVWTELTGATHTRRIRCLRGLNETPVLVRENTLLPISMNGGSLAQTAADDTDRLTLHWFQPGTEAECALADGTRYHVQRAGEQISVHTDAALPFHLIAHEDGVERLIQ